MAGASNGGHQPAAIGAQLRAARLAARKSMAEVAEQSGLTKGFVSKLERDLANVSVASLIRLCDALEISVGSLFQASRGEVVRRGAHPPINFGGSRMREYLLTPSGEKRVQALLSDIEPGGGSGNEATRCPPTWSSCSSWPDSCTVRWRGSRSPSSRATPTRSRPPSSTPSVCRPGGPCPGAVGHLRPPCPTTASTRRRAADPHSGGSKSSIDLDSAHH